MKDVAALAGVSSAAVSRYLNGGYISADKAERIKQARFEPDIRQTGGSRTGYHPFLLDICCVNAPTITLCELRFRKYAAKSE